MADKSIIRRIVLMFDRSAAKKVERETVDSLEKAGKTGGEKAGKGFLKELRDEFNKRKAQLSEQLARGTIDQKEFRKQTAIAAKTFNDGLLKGIEQARRQGKLTDTEYVKLTRSIKRVGDEGQRSIGGRLVASLKKAAVAAGVFFSARAVVQWVRGSVEAFAEFDLAMTRSLAIMGDVDEAMREKMATTAREVAKELNLSAAQVAEGYFYLASAGYSAAQSVASLPQAATFAKAGAFDLATAVDLLTDAQSALGLTTKDATENLRNQTRVSDVLVKANSIANATTQQFSESLTNKAGPALRQLNKDVEEGVAVLAAYADQGIKGEEAGQQLYTVLRDLQRAALANESAFQQVGVTVYDQTGTMRNLADIVADLERALGGLSDQEKRSTLTMLGFQERSIAATQALLGTSEKIRGYETALRSAAGTTQEVTDKQMSAFAEQMGRLGKKIADLRIELGEKLAPVLEGVADNFDDLIRIIPAITKALVAAGLIAGFVRLASAIRAARLATDAWKASMVGAQVLMGPRGWFVLGVAALTELFLVLDRRARAAADGVRRFTSAAREATDAIAAMSLADLEAEYLRLFSQAEKLRLLVKIKTALDDPKAQILPLEMELAQLDKQLVQIQGRIAQLQGSAPPKPTPDKPSGTGGMPSLPLPDVAMVDSLVAAQVQAADHVQTAWTDAFDAIAVAQNDARASLLSFGDVFMLLRQEAGGTGNFVVEMLKGIGAAIVGNLGAFAAGKATENFALAADERVKAAIALAGAIMMPWRVGEAAAHLAASQAAMGMGVKWAALAGASAIGGAAIGASGGRGAAGATGAATGAAYGTVADRVGPPGPEIHIYIDPLDPSEPAVQRVIGEAYQQAAQRYGTQPIIHRRSGS